MTPNEAATVPTESAPLHTVRSTAGPRAAAYRFAQFYGNPRFRGKVDPDCELSVDLECSADSAQPLRKTKVTVRRWPY